MPVVSLGEEFGGAGFSASSLEVLRVPGVACQAMTEKPTCLDSETVPLDHSR
jgi:hypothetical protein